MKALIVLFLYFCIVYCKKESVSDLYDMLNDPRIMSALEKRLKLLDEDSEQYSDEQVGCYDKKGTSEFGCQFTANSDMIIKTNESLQRGAEFLDEIENVSCPSECTDHCCKNEYCDTAVYQDKVARKCFLFRCGDSGACVFSSHTDYWRLTISESTHNSHSFVTGGATPSHENELENLGSHDNKKVTTAPPQQSTTTKKPAPKLPDLNEECPSYKSECADQHAECLGICRCRVGYHEKYGVCRKHCKDEEFECDKIVYGANARQCILNRYVCDNHPDCDDGSDEINCPDKSKPAYLDGDGNNNVYNNPFYNSQNKQPDAQFPYGFPIPGLANQQQPALYPSSNQIYSAQGSPNQNAGGQFFVPGMTNQNTGGVNLLPVKNQYNPQWPINNGVGSQIYPNNVAYPAGQQQNFVPAQTGFIQSPVQPVQKVIQTVQQPVQQNGIQTIPQIPSNQVPNTIVKQNLVPVQGIAVTKAPVLKPVTQKSKTIGLENPVKNEESGGFHLDHYYDTVTDGEAVERPGHRFSDSMISHEEVDKNNYQGKNPDSGSKFPTNNGIEKDFKFNEGMMENGESGNAKEDYVNKAKDYHRHSEEEVDDDDNDYNRGRTYPPSTKTKTQIASPTQSTVSGQKTEQVHSEGFPDYSWLKYDDDSPRVSGKKGKIPAPSSSQNTDSKLSNSRKKPSQMNSISSKDIVPETKPDKFVKPSPKLESNNKIDVDKVDGGRYDTDSHYPDDYRLPFEDYQRPNKNRRPSYNRYDNRYDNSRRRPSPGSRYPYYDSGFQQGWNRERERYPVWDSFKDDYYYPDNYPDRHISHDLDYDGPADKKPSHLRPVENGNRNGLFHPHPDKQPPKPASTTLKTTEKVMETTTLKPEIPSVTDTVKAVDTDIETTDAPKPDSKASSDTDESENKEPVSSEVKSGDQSGDESSSTKSTKSNNTEAETVEVFSEHLKILNADSVEVGSYTDNFQGPIVALALGLAITLMLLIIVGCRLRTVKRRLRKGRQLHSNEADYLINGMYL